MQKQFRELEQRVLMMLKEDSRKSIVDIAAELGISRITARKIVDGMVESGEIIKFTVESSSDQNDLALIHVRSGTVLPDDLVLEAFDLIDGTSLVLVYLENLASLHDSGILEVQIVTHRKPGSPAPRYPSLHCDYCDAVIRGTPISVRGDGKTYYVCCPNCERDMKRRLGSLGQIQK
ncbi:MAG: TRASH domain-containing protein [Thermoplasmataceae archaeon]